MKEFYGYGQAIKCEELWINTVNDERITIKFNDRKEQWDFYCSFLKVTIEKISEEEFNDLIKEEYE